MELCKSSYTYCCVPCWVNVCHSYPGYDARFDQQWGQKRIEWAYSNKSSASGIGPVEDVKSADITCRFAPLQPPALKAVARAGAEVKYVWTDYYNSHQGPVITVSLSNIAFRHHFNQEFSVHGPTRKPGSKTARRRILQG
jgi:hypothetical protein